MRRRRDRTVIGALRRVLDDRRDREADLRPSRVLGRNTDGTPQIQRLDAECIGRGAQSNHYTGQILTLPAGPQYDRKGTSGVALNGGYGAGLALWIDRLDPASFHPGDTSLAVAVYGRGFTATTALEFLEPGDSGDAGTINGDVTIVSQTLISDERINLVINVDGAADAFDGAALAFDSQARSPLGSGLLITQLRYRKANAYAIGLELFQRERWFKYGLGGWDVQGQRLLFQMDYDTWTTRDAAHPTGTTIDKGYYDQSLAISHRSELPPAGNDDTEAIPYLAGFYRYDRADADPVGYYGPYATVHGVGVDAADGTIAAIWSLDSEEGPPWTWRITVWDTYGRIMSTHSATHESQPAANYVGYWQIAVQGDRVITLEPNPEIDPDPGDLVPTRVVARPRHISNADGQVLYAAADWYTEVFSIAAEPTDPEVSNHPITFTLPGGETQTPLAPRVWIFLLVWNGSYTSSLFAKIDPATATIEDSGIVDFDLTGGGFNPWRFTDHGGAYGADVIFDQWSGGWDGIPQFVAMGIDPSTFVQGSPETKEIKLFRFSLDGSGSEEHVATIADPIAVPFARTNSPTEPREYLGLYQWDWPNVDIVTG